MAVCVVLSIGRHLADRLDALDDTQEDDDPGQQQTQGQLPPDVTKVMDAGRYIEHVVPGQQ